MEEVEEVEEENDDEEDEDFDEEEEDDEEEDEDDDEEDGEEDDELEQEQLIQLQSDDRKARSEMQDQLNFMRKSYIVMSALLFAGFGFTIPYLPQPAKDIAQLVHAFMGLLLLGFVLFEILTTQDFSGLIFAGEQVKEDRSKELMSSVAIVLAAFAIGLANFIMPSMEDENQKQFANLFMISLSALCTAAISGRIILNNTIPTYTTKAVAADDEDDEDDEED